MKSLNSLEALPLQKKNSVLLSWPRSGTNYFLAVYSTMFPDNIVFDEIFRQGGDNLSKLSSVLQIDRTKILELVEKTPNTLWNMVEQCAGKSGVGAIAKVFYYHSHDKLELWNHFKEHNKIIHLVRRNPLDIFLSYKIAQQTGVWKIASSEDNQNYEKKSLEIEPFPVSVSEVEGFLRRRQQHMARCRTFFDGADYDEIFYDDISVCTTTCAKVIAELFNVPAPETQIEIGIKKQRKRDPRELVLNYEEIKHFDKAQV